MSVIPIGGLNLYDPNENIGGDQFQSYGFGINPDNNNAVNQEDLIMYCNLRAFTRARSYIMNSNTSNELKTQAVASARINFLKPNPDKDKFTTDWSELNASGAPNGDEMLGINSVQITYDTSYVPRVTITMTDVRGQALNEDPKDSPYGAFFNFPYPMFVLEVKGYYGKAVKYLLHLLKYSSRFDYATGNFQITCEFVGFTYALLSDLNVQYGLVAAQMELNGKTGEERLKEKFLIQKGKYKNITGFSQDIEAIIKSEVYTLIGLINKAKDLNTLVQNLGQQNQFFIKKSYLDNFIDYIRTLYDNINSLESVTNIDFNTRVLEINNDVLIKNYPNEFNNLKYTGEKPDNNTEKLSEKYKKQYNEYWQKSQVIISKSNTEIVKTIDESIKNELTNILGFTPTIRNIMLIICNNFELFLDLLTETTQRAGGNINRNNKLQEIMRNGNPKRENQELEQVYPWPALFDGNFNICYFDDLPTLNINDYPEKEFVEAYLNATTETNKLLNYSGSTVNSLITNPVLFNPVHTQQYDSNNLKLPIFGLDVNEIILNIIEHALLVTSDSFLYVSHDVVRKLGESDGYNFINDIGDNIIKYKWLEDSKNILTDAVKNNLNNNKDKFKYIKSGITSNYLTDIVKTETINNLINTYPTFNQFNFVSEIKSNLLPNNQYDFSVYTSEGFLGNLYNKELLNIPENIYLNWIFEPFMQPVLVGNITTQIYSETLLTEQKLLQSLKNFLMYSSFGVSGDEVLTKLDYNKLIKHVPGITDDYDFILFNGFYTTNMLCSLSYILFDKTFEDTKLNKLFDKKFYFPFTSQDYPIQDAKLNKDITYDLGKVYQFVNGPYKELIEKIVGVFSTDPEVENLDEFELYRETSVNEAKFSINKSTPPKAVIKLRNDKIYQEVYNLIAEFFNSEIKMVSKSNGLQKIYENPNKALGIVKSNKILYNNKKYGDDFNSNVIQYYLEGFTNVIKNKSDEKIKPNSNTEGVKTSLDIKRSLYQTFKNINDKWVIDEPNGAVNNYAWSLVGDVDPNSGSSLFNSKRQFLFDHFFFVDRVNKDIGSKLFIDFRVLNDYYDKVNSKNSLYSIIGELAKMNEMIFHPLTSYIDFNGVTSNNVTPIDGLFKPTTTLDFQSTSPVFIMQYVGKNASYQYDNQNHLPDVIKIDFSNGKFLNPPDSPFILKDNKDILVNQPVAFFVDMGIKNQNMFKGISLDQAEFRETNESITVWDQLTSQKQNRSIQTIGNNIYPILSRRSYTCKVESLGNMMIQPTMYFYLRYVPLFSGLYLITKVSHSIQPNNVVTNFEGVRMSSLNYPLPTQFISTITKEILEKGVINILTNITPYSNYVNNRDNIRIVFNYLNSKINDIKVVAGIMGNLIFESRLNPSIIESGVGAGFGLSQWTGDRRIKIEKWAKDNNRVVTDINTQLDYLWGQELSKSGSGGYKFVLDSMRTAATPEAVAEIFMVKYEVPAGVVNGRVEDTTINKLEFRKKFASEIYNDAISNKIK
jgi:hypothetical protein